MEKRRSRIDPISQQLIVIGFLILLLLIPGGLILGLVGERRARSEEAKREVASGWAEAQTIGGPILTIPFTKRWKDEKGQTHTETDYIYILPESLRYTGEVEPEIRYRGIFKVVLYRAKLSCEGTFSTAGLEELHIPPENIRWHEAFLFLGLSDLRGINEYVKIRWNDRDDLRFVTGIDGVGFFLPLINAKVPIEDRAGEYAFSFPLDLNGCETLSFLPVGGTTVVELQSTWADPSFVGAFLPKSRRITEDGFHATWKVLALNRNYPQQCTEGLPASEIQETSFGVTLFSPVDHYTQTTRAVKYGILFVGLTFLIFFGVEVLNRRRIHPIQYLLVGLALCLFYLLLLSLAEHLGFLPAYLLAAAAVVALITFYAAGVLRERIAVVATAFTLAGLYGFLYFLLINEDYALLIGSLGLFAIMAMVMYLTRKIDWYALGTSRENGE
ncbi:MAG: cell envelope integrity protein CreD [Firmicutes bacterium]|nr:cell envelope integrity protein CreD [Bacillota bacterium]